jgi:hypothetical protein
LGNVSARTTGISKSQVSGICEERDEHRLALGASARPERLLHMHFDTAYCKAKVNHRIVSISGVIAAGITPNKKVFLRLVTAVLLELHDEWIALPAATFPGGSKEICRRLDANFRRHTAVFICSLRHITGTTSLPVVSRHGS